MNYDVVVIGAATSGAYIAKKLASRGFKVLMTEKLSPEKLGTRMDIFHVSKTDLATFDMPQVKQGDKAWAFEFSDNHFSSPSNRYKVPTSAETVGLHMHEYIKLMVNDALGAGAEIKYGASFKEFIFGGGVISGARFDTAEGIKEISARVIIDCSGSSAAARRTLPNGYGVENFTLRDDEKFYVILRYAEFSKPQINNFWLNTKSWFAPFSMNETEKIIGTGAVCCYENAEASIEKLDRVCTEDEFRVIRTEKGTTPYRRPPYSLVADNFIVTGDAACLTKPDCGEGVTSSMVMMDIAADVLTQALKNSDTSKKALWEINTRYNKVQGADFCFVRAFLTNVIKAKDSELEYCFENGIIFNEKFLNGENPGIKDMTDTVKGIIKAAADKKISAATLGSVLKGLRLGIELKELYLRYPDDPEKLFPWIKKADRLWKAVGKVH